MTLSWINVLLVFLPLGILWGAMEWNSSTVFIFNFLAIIPLAKLLGFATEQISHSSGQTIGGLLNATFGNAVELILSIAALKANLIRIIQISLLGSILSNLLLVLGFCFMFGGLKFTEQTFSEFSASTSASMLCITVFSLVIPAAFKAQMHLTSQPMDGMIGILELSRGTAVILLMVYVGYLFFQLKTHNHLFTEDEGEDDDVMETSLPFAIATLLIVTVAVCFCSEFLVGSIEGLAESWQLSTSFIGFILLPLVGNAAEHVSAITFALKNKMSLSISIAIGSSMQLALFVAPLLVILGWIFDREMNLAFTVFEVSILVVSVFVVNSLIMDGRSNWLEGALLLACYAVTSVAFYVMPDEKHNGSGTGSGSVVLGFGK